MRNWPAAIILTLARAVGLALVIFGLMSTIATSIEAQILGRGTLVIGLSLYLIGFVAARRRWGVYPRALGIVLLVAIGITAGGLTDRALRQNTLPARARLAKAQYDTRALASAIRDFAAHCGGLPVGGTNNTTNCTATTAAASGPVDLPSVLLTQRTNARSEVRGPFLVLGSMPTLPYGWKGSGNSYSYYTFASGRFTVCATGDGAGANSDGGTTCP